MSPVQSQACARKRIKWIITPLGIWMWDPRSQQDLLSVICCGGEMIKKKYGWFVCYLTLMERETLYYSESLTFQGRLKAALVSTLAELLNPEGLILITDKNKKKCDLSLQSLQRWKEKPFLGTWLCVIWQLFSLPINLGVWINKRSWGWVVYHLLYERDSSFLKWSYSYSFLHHSSRV